MARIVIEVKPRASRTRVLEATPEAIRIALAAPPVDGAANQELVRFLARTLQVPKRAVRLVRGDLARHKQLEIDGLELAEVYARLAAASP